MSLHGDTSPEAPSAGNQVVAASGACPDRERRVRELHQQVESGEYDVSVLDVADAVIAFYGRDEPRSAG